MMLRVLTAALALAAGAAPATPAFEIDPAGLRRAQYMEALMFGRGEVGGEFALVDHHGVRRVLEKFRGRLVLLYFGYTFCPDVCPSDLVTLSYVLDELPPDAQGPLIDRLWALTKGALVVVEPGTPAGWNRILAVRQRLAQIEQALLGASVAGLPVVLR